MITASALFYGRALMIDYRRGLSSLATYASPVIVNDNTNGPSVSGSYDLLLKGDETPFNEGDSTC